MSDITLPISGMSCGHCLNAVSKALAAVPGVEIKSIQLGRAELRVADQAETADRARSAVEAAGYKVEAVVG
jgi:copper chaperone CopZ